MARVMSAPDRELLDNEVARLRGLDVGELRASTTDYRLDQITRAFYAAKKNVRRQVAGAAPNP
jgi:hypothetical protein